MWLNRAVRWRWWQERLWGQQLGGVTVAWWGWDRHVTHCTWWRGVPSSNSRSRNPAVLSSSVTCGSSRWPSDLLPLLPDVHL